MPGSIWQSPLYPLVAPKRILEVAHSCCGFFVLPIFLRLLSLRRWVVATALLIILPESADGLGGGDVAD